MKNKVKLFGIIALFAVIGFGVIGCNDNPSSNSNTTTTPPPPTTAFSVKGTFDGKKFSLANAETYSRSSVTSGSYAIKGELEDGDLLYKLTGTYDPIDRNYTASAASSVVRFSINGTFDENGTPQGSSATVLTRPNISSDEWTATSFVIAESPDVTIANKPLAEEAPGGIPEFARGWWSENETYNDVTYDAKYLFSQWTISGNVKMTYGQELPYVESMTASVIETENKGGYWDIILGYPVYIGSKEKVEAAAAAFLTKKGLTGTKLDGPPAGFLPDGISYWYEDNDILWGFNGTPSAVELNKLDAALMEWHHTRYLEKYLISQGVNPETRYSKHRATFSRNNTQITLKFYVTQPNDTSEWDTVAKARAASTVYNNPPGVPEVVLTR